MTEIKVLSFAMKILGLYCFILSINYLSILMPTISGALFSNLSNLRMNLALFAPSVPLLIAAFVLIRYADGIAKKLFPSDEGSIIAIQGPIIQWYILSSILMGLFLLIKDVPALISWMGSNWSMQFELFEPKDQARIIESRNRFFVQASIRIPIGLFLVFGSRYIAKVLLKFGSSSDDREP